MLSPAHRRSIHTSLEPIPGEEETDALMSELPLTEADRPVTTATFETAITALRHEMQLGFANLETKITSVRADLGDEIRRMLTALVAVITSALIGGMVLSAGIAAGISQAMGGG